MFVLIHLFVYGKESSAFVFHQTKKESLCLEREGINDDRSHLQQNQFEQNKHPFLIGSTEGTQISESFIWQYDFKVCPAEVWEGNNHSSMQKRNRFVKIWCVLKTVLTISCFVEITL